MNLNTVTTPNTADGTSALLPPKKPKAYQTEFADAHRACRTPAEREQLALVIRDGWTEGELHEYARLYYFRNNKDYPTAMSYRLAIATISANYQPTFWGSTDYKRVSRLTDALEWRKLFRKGGSKPLPPRREGLLRRGRGNGPEVTSDEYAWPEHTEEFRSMIEQRARDYFQLAPTSTLHPNAWAASQRAYWREKQDEAEVLRKETEAVTFHLVPKSRKNLPKGSPRRKLAPQFDDTFWGQTLKPHFNYEFPGHTEAFREEVAALARKDRGKKPDAYISPHMWKVTCHKHYVLIDSNKA
jgi:hypothetical protein